MKSVFLRIKLLLQLHIARNGDNDILLHHRSHESLTYINLLMLKKCIKTIKENCQKIKDKGINTLLIWLSHSEEIRNYKKTDSQVIHFDRRTNLISAHTVIKILGFARVAVVPISQFENLCVSSILFARQHKLSQ